MEYHAAVYHILIFLFITAASKATNCLDFFRGIFVGLVYKGKFPKIVSIVAGTYAGESYKKINFLDGDKDNLERL